MDDGKLGQGALVCIPTYNERENIEKIVPAVLERLEAAHVLVVDDGSPDGTGQLADGMAQADTRVHVLHRERKEGLGRAYLAAFHWALSRGYSKVIEFDADFSHNPDSLPQMVARLDSADVVIGSRRVKGGGTVNWGPVRRLISWGGSTYAKVVLGVPINDLTGGFNGFTRTALEQIQLETLEASGFGFQIEIKYRAVKRGLTVVEMPIVFKDREEGTSKMSSAIVLEALLGVWKLRFRHGLD